jgi:hypothetical protein
MPKPTKEYANCMIKIVFKKGESCIINDKWWINKQNIALLSYIDNQFNRLTTYLNTGEAAYQQYRFHWLM